MRYKFGQREFCSLVPSFSKVLLTIIDSTIFSCSKVISGGSTTEGCMASSAMTVGPCVYWVTLGSVEFLFDGLWTTPQAGLKYLAIRCLVCPDYLLSATWILVSQICIIDVSGYNEITEGPMSRYIANARLPGEDTGDS